MPMAEELGPLLRIPEAGAGEGRYPKAERHPWLPERLAVTDTVAQVERAAFSPHQPQA